MGWDSRTDLDDLALLLEPEPDLHPTNHRQIVVRIGLRFSAGDLVLVVVTLPVRCTTIVAPI